MKINFWKLGISILVSVYFLNYALHPAAGYFIDNANLLIHEAGHLIFSVFGEVIMFLGGSILQVIIPLIFVGYFFYSEQYFSGSLALFWVGQNVVAVSVYVGDAQARVLPLLNGDFNSHDWHFLLNRFNLLSQTETISQIIYIIGLLILILAIVLAVKESIYPKKPLVIE